MNTRRMLPAILGLLVVGGCKSLEVPDLNNPDLGGLQNNPTRSGILTAATGLLVGARANWGSQNGPVAILGILGREGYNLDAADPRFVSSLLIGPLSGGEPAFGGNLWGQHYANIRNANIVLNATAQIVVDPVAGLTAEEKAGVRGFAMTIQALDLLMAAVTRFDNGAPIDVNIDPTGAPAPIATQAEVWTRIETLLDDAYTDLTAPGSVFPFALSSGFAGFNTPATLALVNRGLRARVAVYQDDFTTALTALGQSFIDTSATADLYAGVYHNFGTGSGDVLNAVFDPDARALHAHPSLRSEAQLQTGGARDQRFIDKTDSIAPKTIQGITTDLVFDIYSGPTAPIPIIRNEELILLRAEANVGLNNLVAALDDINYIRQNSGGLPALGPFASQGAALTELLYNKRYSLIWEGGHRWIDMRHYGLLGSLPQDLGTHRRFPKFPFPINECTPRSPAPAGCAEVPGS